MSLFRKKKATEPVKPQYNDPFPDEAGKAFSKNALIPDDSQITSPEELADELLAGTVILGCGNPNGAMIYIQDVYVIRDEKLFEMKMAGDRDLHLMNIRIEPDDGYRDAAYEYYYRHSVVLADRTGIIQIQNAHYPEHLDETLDIKSMLGKEK